MVSKIRIELAKGPQTEEALKATLAPRGQLSFSEEVALRTEITRTLRTLKTAHKAYPIKGKWHLTKRGGKR